MVIKLDRLDSDNFCSNDDKLLSVINNDVRLALDKIEPHILAAVVINLDAVTHNYHTIKKELRADTKIGGVIKANAYGFGMIPVGKRLYVEGCRDFFVATIEEGIEVRKALPKDVNIFVLSGIFANCEDLLLNHSLIPVLNSMMQVHLWSDYSRKINKKLDAVIHVDTGMCRNGISMDDAQKYHEKIVCDFNLRLVLSHMACADTPNHPMNEEQRKKFSDVLHMFGNVKGSFSATNGIFLGKDYIFDMVRPGKSLYGFSIREDRVGSLEPVMDVFARIVQINEIDIGDTIGYGATFVATRKTKTITIGIGYADGFMRKFGGFGHGFIAGKKIPVVGRISMDYMVLDVTDVDDSLLVEGNWVALTRTPDYTLEKWALELGTLPHEVACRFGDRVKRIYIGQ